MSLAWNDEDQVLYIGGELCVSMRAVRSGDNTPSGLQLYSSMTGGGGHINNSDQNPRWSQKKTCILLITSTGMYCYDSSL